MKKSILVGLLALWLIVSVVPVFAQERDQTDAAWQSWREGKIADAHASALSMLSRAPDDDRARHLIILTSFQEAIRSK